MKNISEKLKQIKQLKTDYIKEQKALFDTFLQEIFEYVPEIKLFMWQQYIPSFNDGDPCSFSISGPYIFSNDNISEWSDEDSEYYDESFEEVTMNLQNIV